MKNLFKSALMLLACGAFFACSSEDEVVLAPEFKGDQAYLMVNIEYANGGTRAEVQGFENASGSEMAINTVHCYFYDDAGNFLTVGEPTLSTQTDKPETGVQFAKTNCIVLKHLGNQMPSQMVVVVNQPKSFEGMTLAQASKALAVVDYSITDNAGFMMTSTSYDGNTNLGNCAYKLVATDFLEEAPNPEKYTDASTIKVYVERVAVKTRVNTSLTANADGLYEIGNFEVNTDINGGTDAIKTIKLYAEINGWGLNVTAKEYLPFKDIVTGKADYFTNWDASGLHRSYWGAAPYYADATATKYAVSEAQGDGDKPAQVVEYNNWYSLNTALSTATNNYEVYCAPNTHALNVLVDAATKNTYYTNRLTNVLVAATVKMANPDYDENVEGSEKYLNAPLCRYAGILFLQDNFKALALENNKQYFVADDNEEEGYRNLNTGEVTFENAYDGKASVVLNVADGTKFYTRSKTKETGAVNDDPSADGWYYYVAATTNVENGFKPYVAEVYTGGKMYYTIPVEHNLAWTADKNYTKDGYNFGTTTPAVAATAKVGDYGMVRNHIYALTINAIGNLGRAVYDPTKDIVPNDDDNKLYWLGATINVLQWRTITQQVNL